MADASQQRNDIHAVVRYIVAILQLPIEHLSVAALRARRAVSAPLLLIGRAGGGGDRQKLHRHLIAIINNSRVIRYHSLQHSRQRLADILVVRDEQRKGTRHLLWDDRIATNQRNDEKKPMRYGICKKEVYVARLRSTKGFKKAAVSGAHVCFGCALLLVLAGGGAHRTAHVKR